MDSQAWMTTMNPQRWSSGNFPIGIGLAAAAHMHLRNKFHAMADEQERGHLLRKSIMSMDQVLGALEDLHDIDNAILMLDKAIEELEGKRPEPRMEDQANAASHRRRRKLDQRHRQRKARERAQLAHAGTVANAVLTEVESGFSIELSRLPRFPEESTSWTTTDSEDEQFSQAAETHSASSRRMQPPPTPPPASFVDLTQWSTACHELRNSRNASIEKTIRQVAAFEPLLVGLDKSYSSALCWTIGAVVRFAVTTGPVSNVIARVLAGAQRIAMRLGIVASSSANASPTSSAAATIASSFRQSTTFLFLPLVPTLLVSGMHFTVAVRARWMMFKIQRTYRESMMLAKKHSVASTLLSIRQQRLEWLHKEIEAFEREEQDRNNGAPSDSRTTSHSDANASNVTDLTDDRNSPDNSNNNNRRHLHPADRRVQLAIEQFNNAVSAGLRSSSLGTSPNHDSGRRPGASVAQPSATTATTTSSSSATRTDTTSLADRRGRHFVLKNPGIQMLGPDLYTMDLDKFLRDQRERRRILRLEAKAMRTDLRFMRQQVIEQSKKAAAQAGK